MCGSSKSEQPFVIRVGVDLGNVVIDHTGFGTTEEYVRCGDYCRIPPVKGAIEGIVTLMNSGVDGLAIIYNATDVADEKIDAWLDQWLPGSIVNDPRFVKVRSSRGRDKSHECLELGITHFVDDRAEVLKHLGSLAGSIYLFNPRPLEELEHNDPGVSYLKVVEWSHLVQLILKQ